MLSGFERMNTYALASLSSGLDDARLPKVLEGLVLILEGLGSIGLACQERRDKRESGGGEEDVVKKMKVDISGIIGPIVCKSRLIDTTLLSLISSFTSGT
jgi:ataxin-10